MECWLCSCKLIVFPFVIFCEKKKFTGVPPQNQFMLLSGRAPFSIKKGGKNAMFRAIRAADFVFYDDYWGDISMSAKKLVLSMLYVNPNSRVSAKEALESEWINTKDERLMSKSLDRTLEEIQGFCARRKWGGAIGAVMYVRGGKFWDDSATTFSRENFQGSDRAVDGDVGEGSKSDIEPPTFEKLYALDKKLQEGIAATVYAGHEIETGKKFAIKVIGRQTLSQNEDAAVLNEVSILKSLRHKHIVPLLDFFEAPDAFYMVMKKCNGGDVLDRVASLEQYSEKDACQLSIGLLQVRQSDT